MSTLDALTKARQRVLGIELRQPDRAPWARMLEQRIDDAQPIAKNRRPARRTTRGKARKA